MYKFGIVVFMSLHRCSLIQPISCSAVQQLVHKSTLLIFLALYFRLLSGSNEDENELISQKSHGSLCTNTPSKEKKRVDYVVQRRNE